MNKLPSLPFSIPTNVLSRARGVAGLVARTAAFCLVVAGCASPPPPAPPAPVVVVKPSQVIPIKQTARGVLIVMPLDKVAFDFGKASVTATEAHEFLDRVASILKDKTTHNIVLEGHTDSVGTRVYNQKLAEDRAATIRQELGRRGVGDARMSTQGFAFDQPVASNETEAGRRENRRVELTILGETVANITRGEPPGSFEEAFSRLKSAIDKDGVVPSKTP